jgi:hypothetical protein
MSLIKNIARFARSPQGRRLVDQGKRAAQDPENRRKLEAVRARLAKKR